MNAPEEVSIRNLLAPLTSIGVVSIEGERPAALLTAWHPLRLSEIGAKARQLADAVKQVVTSSGSKRASIEDFVNDRAASLTRTYYGDVAVLQEHDDHLLAETDSLADCSLLETASGTSHHGLTDEPVDGAVAAFERVGDEYGSVGIGVEVDIRGSWRANQFRACAAYPLAQDLAGHSYFLVHTNFRAQSAARRSRGV